MESVPSLGIVSGGRGDGPPCNAAEKADLSGYAQGIGNPAIGKTKSSCVERHYIEKKNACGSAPVIPGKTASRLAGY